MIENSSNLVYGQDLIVDIGQLKDRISPEVKEKLKSNPHGTLIGYKMVDGNQFGLVLKLKIGLIMWFFESELIESVNKDR